MDINYSKPQNSDPIIELPTDKTQPTHAELKVLDTLFKENYTHSKSLKKTAIKYSFLTFLIMLFYFIPNDTVKQILPAALNKNEYIPVFLKAVLISVIFYFFEVYLKH